MPGSTETVRAIAETMLDEELMRVLDQLDDDQPPSLFQSTVIDEAMRRRLASAPCRQNRG